MPSETFCDPDYAKLRYQDRFVPKDIFHAVYVSRQVIFYNILWTATLTTYGKTLVLTRFNYQKVLTLYIAVTYTS